MPEPVIALDHLSRVYHAGEVDVWALRDVSLRIAVGEFVAIVGSSGSGKSTLMAILGCLDRPTSGAYRLDGLDVSSLSEPELAAVRSGHVGFVFQTFNLLPRTSAIENVALPLIYTADAPRRAERSARARAALAALGLAYRERNMPSQLSGGQQQRVAIARALINHPSLLLADEPTGNVDTRTSHEIMAQLTALNRERGVTVVVVTHEADIAAYADRVITLRDGEVIGDERRREPAAPASSASATAAPVPAGGPAPTTFMLMALANAAQALRRNAMRSALTMLGVFIGVAALIAMVAVGQGANVAVTSEIAGLGTNLIVVVPGAATASGVRGGFGSGSTLTVDDAVAVRRDDLAVLEAGYTNRQVGQVQAGGENWMTQILGVSPNYPQITNWQIAAGRGIEPEDDGDARLVTVLGQTVARQLFPDGSNPVGAMVLVRGVPTHVIGLYVAKGQTPFGQDQDDVLMMPFTTAERRVLGVATPVQLASAGTSIYAAAPNPFGVPPRLTGYVNSLFVQATDGAHVAQAIDQVTATLARRHHIRPGETNDFSVRNLSQVADVIQNSSRVLALLLATVASISLVVGGIGIMNILLVSVTERTREIGLRLAIGARRVHVLLQFLAEAVFLSLIGGGAGILAGIGVSMAISLVAGWPTQVSLMAVTGGFVFSVGVGVFFGYYPARKASRLDPMDALRYE